MKTIKDVDMNEKRVLIRADLNVPLDAKQQITDDMRIRAVLPSLTFALEKNAKLIIASHLGRPKGKPAPAMSLMPVAERLEALLGREVKLAPDCVGDAVEKYVAHMHPGDVVLLENLRFHPQEQQNDHAFGSALAGLCDVYINDAFAVSHRENASVVAAALQAPVSAAGFLLEKEMHYFEQAMTNPRRPLVAVVGGAKVSGKLKALANMLEKVDKLIIGGAMANTFLKSRGFDMGRSKIEADLIPTAGAIMKKAAEKGVKFYLPVDVVVAEQLDPGAKTQLVPVAEIPKDGMALDVGPASSLLFAEALQDAGTIVWNGPMGVFEMAPFSTGTIAMARDVAASSGLTIIGGGDTLAAVHMAKETDRISYMSTGGGAFLALLEGKTLPGVSALQGG